MIRLLQIIAMLTMQHLNLSITKSLLNLLVITKSFNTFYILRQNKEQLNFAKYHLPYYGQKNRLRTHQDHWRKRAAAMPARTTAAPTAASFCPRRGENKCSSKVTPKNSPNFRVAGQRCSPRTPSRTRHREQQKQNSVR
jgi:hypothetical protein